MEYKIVENQYWKYYVGDKSELDREKVGKWMYFFDDVNKAETYCAEAVQKGIVAEAKHSNAENGVSCFYLNVDEIDRHKEVIRFFIDNNMIQKTKTGKLYNISFKLDNQTRNQEYGEDFKAKLTLSELMDLNNQEWIV